MTKEEYILQWSMLEQEASKLQEQMQIIEQHFIKLQHLKQSLEEVEKTKEKEILANLGKNIFIKTEIKDKNLLVDIGNRVFVKKTPKEAVEIIEEQVEEMEKTKMRIINKLQEMQGKMQEIIEQAEKEK